MSTPSIEAAKRAQEIYYLKQQAVKFYNENGIPQRMEEILNSTFYENPNDVYGHVANFFESFALKPTISQVVAMEGFDTKGQPALTVEVIAKIKNHDKLVSCVTSPAGCTIPDSARSEDKEDDDVRRRAESTAALQLINDELEALIRSADPAQQREIDAKIDDLLADVRRREEEARVAAAEEDGEPASQTTEKPSSSKKPKSPAKGGKGGKAAAVVIIPDEPAEVLPKGHTAAPAASSAVCVAGAVSRNIQPFEHVVQLAKGEVPEKLSLPLPLVTIIQNGKAYPGKLQFLNELMIFPRTTMPICEAMKRMQAVYQRIANNLVAKTGGKGAPPPLLSRLGTDCGALCPSLDKAEQALDMINEALTAMELTPGEDFFYGIRCASKEIYDYEKGKYDVIVGGAKSVEDTVEMYADLVSRYPIKLLIDPIRKEEKDPWMTLCERVSENCLVLGDDAHPRAELLSSRELTAEWRTSGAVLKLEGTNTVSHIMMASDKLRQEESAVVISSGSGDSTDSFIVDLAVGVGADFLQVGAPVRGEKIGKWMRLMHIERMLDRESKLQPRGDLTYPQIEKPAPPEEELTDDGAKTDSAKESKSKR